MSVNFTDDAGREGWEASGGMSCVFMIGQGLMVLALPSGSAPNVGQGSTFYRCNSQTVLLFIGV